MRRRRVVEAAQGLPPLPHEEKRDQQVKIRLSISEVEQLIGLRPDLTASGVVAVVVDDLLSGRYRPTWAAASSDAGEPK